MNAHHHPSQSEAHSHFGNFPDHVHGTFDPTILITEKGIGAIKMVDGRITMTGLLQAAVVAMTFSVALLADTIHNFGDAAPAGGVAII